LLHLVAEEIIVNVAWVAEEIIRALRIIVTLLTTIKFTSFMPYERSIACR